MGKWIVRHADGDIDINVPGDATRRSFWRTYYLPGIQLSIVVQDNQVLVGNRGIGGVRYTAQKIISK